MRAFLVPAIFLALSLPVQAETTFGLGVNLSFGGGAGPQTGVGVRMFSGDKKNSTVASVGFDYLLQAGKIRPSVGVAYLGSNTYIGADLGFTPGQGLNFGLGLGLSKTQTKAAPVASEEPV